MDRMIENGRPRVRIVPDAEQEAVYAGSLSGIFDELVEINLKTGQCRSIFYTEHVLRLASNRTVEDFRVFAWENIHPEECRSFIGAFEKDALERIRKYGKLFQLSFRCRSPQGGYTWMRILLIPERTCEDILLCYVADLGGEDRENHLLKQIVDRYVYKKCDYLICLDTANDTYSLFLRNEGASLFPPDPSGSYSRMVRDCVDSYVVPEDREMVLAEMDISRVLEVLDREGEHVITYGVRDPEKGYFRKRFQYVYYDRSSHMVLLMRTDITQEYSEQCRQKRRLKDALEHARIDSLTGLCNRQTIQREISRILDDPMCPRSVLLFMDLDNFKKVNDTLGHRSGDRVLCRVADLFRQTLRASDLIGRIGGDEFVAFLTGVASEQEGMDCARRLCDAMNRITGPELGDIRLSCSIGGAVCPKDGRDYETLFVKADTALYEAKRRGRNQSVFY